MWERHLQCAAVRADARDPHGATVAAGSEKSVVLIWRLKGKGSLETGPCEVYLGSKRMGKKVHCLLPYS